MCNRYLNLMCRTGQELPLGQTINMYKGQKIFDARFGIGYASAVEGTWSEEDNCVLVASNMEDARECESLRKNSGDMYNIYHDEALLEQLAELETEPSPTHYYAVRKSAQRVLYDYVNSNNMKNGLNRDIAEVKLSFVSGSRNAASIAFDTEAIGTRDIAILGVEGLPEGLSANAKGAISGRCEAGEYALTVSILMDGWVKAKVPVTLTVTAE